MKILKTVLAVAGGVILAFVVLLGALWWMTSRKPTHYVVEYDRPHSSPRDSVQYEIEQEAMKDGPPDLVYYRDSTGRDTTFLDQSQTK